MQTPSPINEEYIFDKGLIISSTNLKGIITYANRKFCEVSGYSKDELINQSHNIIRHPDMPKSIFKELWETLALNKEWTGIIKNLRQDGKYYWVYAHISSMTEDDTITGYTAARRPASDTEILETSELYNTVLIKEASHEQ